MDRIVEAPVGSVEELDNMIELLVVLRKLYLMDRASQIKRSIDEVQWRIATHPHAGHATTVANFGASFVADVLAKQTAPVEHTEEHKAALSQARDDGMAAIADYRHNPSAAARKRVVECNAIMERLLSM